MIFGLNRRSAAIRSGCRGYFELRENAAAEDVEADGGELEHLDGDSGDEALRMSSLSGNR